MTIQSILEIKRMHEIHKLEALMEETIKEANYRDEMSKKQSNYVNPAALRLGILTKQVTLPRREPANYCPV